MFILTSNRAEAKEKNNKQSFSAQDIGKNVKRLTIRSVGKGRGAPLAEIQTGLAFTDGILAIAKTISSARILPEEILFFCISPRELFTHVCKEPYPG